MIAIYSLGSALLDLDVEVPQIFAMDSFSEVMTQVQGIPKEKARHLGPARTNLEVGCSETVSVVATLLRWNVRSRATSLDIFIEMNMSLTVPYI